MPKGFYRAIAKEIKSCGYEYLKNAKGSHEKWENVETGEILLVPKNLKSKHTANGILKDAGSDRRV